MILHNTDCEDPMAANIEELINCLKREKEEIEYNFETIECICKQCQNKTEIKRDSDVFKTKFFRCRKCGYVVGPIINHVPKDYFYIVKDDSNVVEPEK